MKILYASFRPVQLDDEDFDRLSKHTWCYNKGYVKHMLSKRGIHNYILPRKEGFDIDHIDRNTLNNTKDNLRYLTRRENVLNSERSLQRKLPPGIRFRNGSYSGRTKKNGKVYTTLSFSTRLEAQHALNLILAEVSAK